MMALKHFEESEERFFINLHCPYEIACIRYHMREYNLDKSGRLLWLLKKDRKVERSLNNRFVEKWDMGNDGIFKSTRVLTEKEADIIYLTMTQDLSEILGVLKSNPTRLSKYSVTQNIEEVISFIEKAISNDYQKAIEDKKRFEEIYGPIEIFPNDLPMPLIIQLTQGCSYNKCTFCGFYKDKPFRTKDLHEVKQHIKDIKSFMGESILNRQSIFVGDANALMIPQDLLLHMLDTINEELPIDPPFDRKIFMDNISGSREGTNSPLTFEGIYSFMDAFYGLQKNTRDFTELKRRNVKKIYIGMESGSDSLLSFIKKCHISEDIITVTNRIKDAGIPAGIMLIAGLGGKRFYHEHVEESINTINQLHLDALDTIYFSHLFFHENAPYKNDMKRARIGRLSYEEENCQIQEIIDGLAFPPINAPDTKGYEIQFVRF